MNMNGKKTYIAVIIGMIISLIGPYVVALDAGVTVTEFESALTVIVLLAIAAVRHAIAKGEPKKLKPGKPGVIGGMRQI